MPDFKPLLQKLIACRTASNNREELARCLALLEQEFLPYFHVRRYRRGACPILVFSTTRQKKFDLIMACHIDVVPAPVSEFNLRQQGGKYYGRGVYDMKGPLAACLYALRDWSLATTAKKAVALVVSGDEETGGQSIRSWLAAGGYDAKFVLVPDDGTENEIVVREKGRLHLQLTISGRSAHASTPHEGENPIERLFALYSWLHQKFPLPKHAQDWCTSVVLTKVAAGEAVNQIPDCAEAYLDVRYVRAADRKRVLFAIRRYLGRAVRCQILSENNIFTVSEQNHYVRKLAQSVRAVTGRTAKFVSAAGTSDAHAFSDRGLGAALIYPVGGGIHQSREWVSVASLQRFYKIIRNFLEIF